MWFFGLIIWLLLPLFFMGLAVRRWQWRRWAMIEGARGYSPYVWRDPSEWYGQPGRRFVPEQRPDSDQQQAIIDALETRVAELEERLDFTERLLEGRHSNKQ